jgi:ABC-2 type transport system permease protein
VSELLPLIRGVYGIWLREILRATRDRGQMIGGVSRPLIWLLIMGVGLNPYFRGEVFGEVRYVVPYTYLQFLFPAVIVLNIMYTSIQFAVSVIWDREFGFLREVLVSPMPRPLILLGKVLGGATAATLHGGIVLILARFADVTLTPIQVVTALGLMFALSFGLTCFGVMLASRIRSFEGFGVFSNTLILPLYFASSSVFPLDPALTRTQTAASYPEWLVFLVQINPITYAVDCLRGVLIGFNQFTPAYGPIIIASMAVGFFLLALVDFGRTK